MALPAQKPSIDTCNACGKLFPRVRLRLCTQCAVIEDNRFQLVRDFVLDNDGAPVGDIAGATGVSAADVRHFMEGGRLIETSGGLAACTCGGVGTRCRYCRSRLTNTFRDMEASMRRDQESRGGPATSEGWGGRASGSAASDADTSRTSYVRRIRRLGDQG